MNVYTLLYLHVHTCENVLLKVKMVKTSWNINMIFITWVSFWVPIRTTTFNWYTEVLRTQTERKTLDKIIVSQLL